MFDDFDWFSFIFGGVIVSFIVNIISGMAQPIIENYIQRFNRKLRTRNLRLAKHFTDEVERLVANPHEELIARSKANARLIDLTFSFLCFLLLVFSLCIFELSIKSLIIGWSCICLSGVVTLFRDYPNQIHNILKEVDSRKERPTKSLALLK